MTLIKGTKQKRQLFHSIKTSLESGVPPDCRLTKRQQREINKKVALERSLASKIANGDLSARDFRMAGA